MQGLYSHLMHSSMCRCKCSAGELSTRQPECIGTINWMQGVLGKFELVVNWRRREILWLRFRCSAAHTSDGHCSAFLWISSLFPSLSHLSNMWSQWSLWWQKTRCNVARWSLLRVLCFALLHVFVTIVIKAGYIFSQLWLNAGHILSQLWSKQVTFYHNCVGTQVNFSRQNCHWQGTMCPRVWDQVQLSSTDRRILTMSQRWDP